MKIIKDYKTFINESSFHLNGDTKDIMLVLDDLKELPTDDILKFRDAIEGVVQISENLNESYISDMIGKIRLRFDRWLDDLTWKRIINRKKEFYSNLVEMMNIFDLKSLDDVVTNYPGFKLESLYLAGGMDKAIDVGAGWRNELEFEFETYKRNDRIASTHEEISFGELGTFKPCRVIEGKNLSEFIINPDKIKRLYDVPVTLNPVRKEVDRTKSIDFATAAVKYKSFSGATEPEEYEPTMTHLRKTLSKSIEPDDEQLVRIVDGVFLGLNIAAAGGTFGELETASYMRKPIFVWMTDKNWKFSDFSIWNFPHITKLCRNKNEMKILVKTLIDFAK